MRGSILMAAVLVTTAAGAAMAGERTAYPSIAAGDLASAERMLLAERRIFPDRPALMLNLAAVYRQTGRTGEAAALYRSVLARPAVTMDMPGGTTRSSHAIASTALDRFALTTLANR